MEIFSAKQMHNIDAQTIEKEPITSIDLMERAAGTFFDKIIRQFPTQKSYCIFCGKGNNGGDGLAISRMLLLNDKEVSVFIVNYTDSASDDFLTNYEHLLELQNLNCNIIELSEYHDITIPSDAIIIDGIFGSGLNRPITGFVAEYVSFLNSLTNTKIAIDIPSGLYADVPVEQNAVVFKADETITFQSPKLQFLFAENEQFVGSMHITDISLINPFSDKETPFEFITQDDIKLHECNIFAHKGSFGHALLVSGSYGKMGAAVLASKSCLRTGCGLLTTHCPEQGLNILQTTIPEAMVSIDENPTIISDIPSDDKYSAVGIGPGIGTDRITAKTLHNFLQSNTKPLVLDADALNIIAQNPQMWEFIKPNTVITPHPKEFDRLTHFHSTCYERFKTQISFAQKHNCIVVLKGHYTSIASPDGKVYFNSTGNPGMATAGSGDVLTGIILSLLAQKYEPLEAAKIGVFIHGLAGDYAQKTRGTLSLIASDIIEHLHFAIKDCQSAD